MSFIVPSLFSRAGNSHVDTLGAEKKSGVPHILTSHARHRQTPFYKHDQKTRHMDGNPSTQRNLRISLVILTLAKFCMKRKYAVAYVVGGLAGLPNSSEGAAVAGRPPYRWVRGSALLPWVIRPARRAGPTSWSRQARPLPWFRAGGRYSVPLLAAQSRHEKPYPPISKIKHPAL